MGERFSYGLDCGKHVSWLVVFSQGPSQFADVLWTPFRASTPHALFAEIDRWSREEVNRLLAARCVGYAGVEHDEWRSHVAPTMKELDRAIYIASGASADRVVGDVLFAADAIEIVLFGENGQVALRHEGDRFSTYSAVKIRRPNACGLVVIDE